MFRTRRGVLRARCCSECYPSATFGEAGSLRFSLLHVIESRDRMKIDPKRQELWQKLEAELRKHGLEAMPVTGEVTDVRVPLPQNDWGSNVIMPLL